MHIMAYVSETVQRIRLIQRMAITMYKTLNEIDIYFYNYFKYCFRYFFQIMYTNTLWGIEKTTATFTQEDKGTQLRDTARVLFVKW